MQASERTKWFMLCHRYMRSFESQSDCDSRITRGESTVARPLAPEDIRVGDFITYLREMVEFPSFLWCTDAATVPPHEMIRAVFLPKKAGVPLKVVSICLPFVLVKPPTGRRRIVDVRRYALARLDKAYAMETGKSLRHSNSKRKQN